MPTAREAAVAALLACRKSGAFSEKAVEEQVKRHGLDTREAALAGKLCFGVLRHRGLLDFYLGQVSHMPVGKIEPRVLEILRTAVYQMVFLDRIPPRAAVDEAVKLVKRGNPRAAGFSNALLRRISERLDDLPEPPREDLAAYLAIKYSHPLWLVERFLETLEFEEAERLLAANNAQPPLYAQVNRLKTDAAQVKRDLLALDVKAWEHPWLSDCLLLPEAGRLTSLRPFLDGDIYIQDPAARLAVLAADPRPSMRLLDVCAAPGGKSFAAAIQMENRGEIVAADIQEKKLDKIREGAKRLGISILSTRLADAREADRGDAAPFDIVLADVPCSGMGVIRKKPEIRYKSPEEIAALPGIQLAILRGAARQVAPGGLLLYSTCTLLREENEDLVAAFLRGQGAFVPEEITNLPKEIGRAAEEGLTLYPHIHDTDGFFLCKLRRVK